MEPPKLPVDRFRSAMFAYFDKYLREIKVAKETMKISLPLAMFLSGISFDVYSENDVAKAMKDEVFKYLTKVQVHSMYDKEHKDQLNPMSFILCTPLQSLKLTKIPTAISWTDTITNKLTSLQVEQSPLSVMSLDVTWPYLRALTIKKSAIKMIPPKLFV